MGDGTVKKIAVVMNGDPHELRHDNHISLAEDVLVKEGYTVHTYNAAHADGRVGQKYEEFNSKIKGLNTDDDDELVIYVTGHGNDSPQGPYPALHICDKVKTQKSKRQLSERMLSVGQEFLDAIDQIQYGKRTIVMDTCYSGGLRDRFIQKRDTTFISAAGVGEKALCDIFAPFFWGATVLTADFNEDQRIDWHERYTYAVTTNDSMPVKMGMPRPHPIYATNNNNDATALPAFSRIVVTQFSSMSELNKHLSSLNSDQYAVLLTSTSNSYDYEVAAREYGGNVLFLHYNGSVGQNHTGSSLSIYRGQEKPYVISYPPPPEDLQVSYSIDLLKSLPESLLRPEIEQEIKLERSAANIALSENLDQLDIWFLSYRLKKDEIENHLREIINALPNADQIPENLFRVSRSILENTSFSREVRRLAAVVIICGLRTSRKEEAAKEIIEVIEDSTPWARGTGVEDWNAEFEGPNGYCNKTLYLMLEELLRLKKRAFISLSHKIDIDPIRPSLKELIQFCPVSEKIESLQEVVSETPSLYFEEQKFFRIMQSEDLNYEEYLHVRIKMVGGYKL